ncbi:dihydrolipoamide acetyltransferase family protein [Arthrobacter russicus]|uniref:dihydrolipoamide acetyltransferase family protein n=1 Tax=Arthrobacter russicus TaxID=172040 RepID=UPI00286B59EF|nr:dihydrolipoamide acetyltransferase family protein [Arthrobacter russicus]
MGGRAVSAALAKQQVFLLPDLGEGLTEAELVRWLVSVGDNLVVDQPIAEVETAKSLVEIPSPFAGVVAVLHGEAGQLMDVGKPFLTVDGPDAADPHEGYREEERAGSGNVLIGYGTSGHTASGRSRPRKAAAASVPGGAAAAANTPAANAPAANTGVAPLVISPLVRKLARESGISLHGVTGSGPGGLILRKDIVALGAAITSADPAALPGIDPRSGLSVVSRTPLTGVRKAIAANLSRSRSEIPEATVWVEVDATALVEMRAALKQTDPANTPGLLAFIARFVLAGLAKFPELNTRIDDGALLAVDGVNLGFAAQTDRGLVVPSIRAAELLSAREIDVELRRLTELARAGKASPAELSRGTFTLNNYGVFGVDGSAAIINYPESAILGVGRIIDKPWVVQGELAVRKVTELTLVFDHRVCDGGTAGGFLRYVADAMENPATVLADL